MKKIPTLFVRDPDTRRVDTTQVTPGCEWVLAGEGTPTRKYAGTCVMFDGQTWWGRREVKPGKQPPPRYQPVETDPVTGKTVGWEPIEQTPFVKAWREALTAGDSHLAGQQPGTTFELFGPKINGNPERAKTHQLIPHGFTYWAPGHGLTVTDLIGQCRSWCWEGIVWHHPDGRKAKLKVKDLP